MFGKYSARLFITEVFLHCTKKPVKNKKGELYSYTDVETWLLKLNWNIDANKNLKVDVDNVNENIGEF